VKLWVPDWQLWAYYATNRVGALRKAMTCCAFAIRMMSFAILGRRFWRMHLLTCRRVCSTLCCGVIAEE